MLADLGRTAFAVGYASTTAGHGQLPLTDRARNACEAAARVVESSQPAAANATLQLGQLEGIWAVIYARREAIERLHGKALGEVLAAIAELDWPAVIDRVGTYLLINPDISRADLEQLLAADIRSMIANRLPAEAAQAWRAAMNQALIAATAEGQTAALALIGDAAGIRIDWELAATAAQDALADSQVAWDGASTWIEQQIHGMGYQVSQTIARMWADGATASDIEAEVGDLLTVTRSTAGVLLDTAVGQAIAVGALNTYATAGVLYADFLTAGDGRVCAACGDAEDNNSYQLEQCPQPPLHLRCRCTIAPSAGYEPSASALALVSTYEDTSMEDIAA